MASQKNSKQSGPRNNQRENLRSNGTVGFQSGIRRRHARQRDPNIGKALETNKKRNSGRYEANRIFRSIPTTIRLPLQLRHTNLHQGRCGIAQRVGRSGTSQYQKRSISENEVVLHQYS